jgi:hypothetical protein
MARSRKPSLRQYATMLDDHNFRWLMDIEMKQMQTPAAEVRRRFEAKEDELLSYTDISEMHMELWNAYYNHATEEGPKPKLVEAGREHGKIVYKIIHDNGDGLIFDWRKQHV